MAGSIERSRAWQRLGSLTAVGLACRGGFMLDRRRVWRTVVGCLAPNLVTPSEPSTVLEAVLFGEEERLPCL